MTLQGRRGLAVGLLLVYVASRAAGITALPGFVDESWHTMWALSIAEGRRLFRPWEFGKGLSVFANALVLPWFSGHVLEASRLLTTAFGALTLLATWGLSRRLYDDRTALVAGLFYVLCPFTLFYDRLALTDPVMSTFSALTLLASVRLARSRRPRDAVLTGLALAALILSKALGVMLVHIPAAAWLALARPRRRGARALALAYVVAGILVAWPLWSFLTVSGAVGQAVGGAGAEPLERLARNLPLVEEWLVGWWTLPLLLLALAGTLAASVRRQPSGLLLAAVWLAPLVALLPTAGHWYPRYLLFMGVPTLILAARALTSVTSWAAERLGDPFEAWKHVILATATTLVLLPSLRTDVHLWVEPSRAPLPAIERMQFIDGWPSGYGVRETVAFVGQELDRHPEGVNVVMDSRSRPTTGFALNVAFRGEPRLHRRDLPLNDPAALTLLEKWARERPTLVVVPPMAGGRARPSPRAWAHLGGVRAHETRKPNGDLCDQIYQLAEPAQLGAGDEERSRSDQ